MQALILAGGKGTRFMEETVVKPKPMIEICDKPILFHIIDHYSFFGVDEFIILAGYKIEYIIDYFNKQNLKYKHGAYVTDKNLKIKVLDTGNETMTGGRIKRASEFINEKFFLTYGDGLANVNLNNLKEFHNSKNTLATVTAVRPPARFGSLTIKDSKVIEFGEKHQSKEGWINGGFFVLSKQVIDLIEDDSIAFEQFPLEFLASSGNLSAYKHEGFWYPVDTLREKLTLEKYVEDNNGSIPWAND